MQKNESGITKKIIEDLHKKNNIQLLDLSSKYHENSKITRENYEDIFKIELLFTDAEIIKKLLNTHLSYIDTEEIFLPTNDIEISKSFYECIQNRRSLREFTGESINLQTLSNLLWHSYGITGMMKLRERETGEEVEGYLKSIPSGGSLYPIELYVAIINIDEVTPGIYHYNTKKHSLELLTKENDFINNFAQMFTIHPEVVDISKSCAVFILSSSFWKQNGKYGPRGYRFALMEAGHIGQNIQLASTGLDLGSVCIGGYFDDELNKLLDLDGINEGTIYAVAIGIPENNTMALNLKAGMAKK